jgi:fibronectin-binding autotransporter adhesin
MKLTSKSAFRKTTKSAPAESQDGLPQYSIGFRAMALLTASIVFFQAPVSLIAAVWDPFSQYNSTSRTFEAATVEGGSYANVGNGSHWFGRQAPGSGETAQFNLGLNGYTVTLGTVQLGGISIFNDGDGNPASSVTLGTSGAFGSLSVGVNGILVSQGALVLDQALRVSLGGAQTWSVDAGGVIDARGVISAGSVSYSILKAGAGALILSGSNTFDGGVALNSGVIQINASGASSANSAIGVGVLTINGGSLDNTSTGTVALATNNTQAWNGDFTYIGSQGRVLNMGTGAVTLGANRNVTVSAGEFAVGGIIGGTYSLTKAGAGKLTLSGANTFDGGLTLSEGQINLNNDAAAGTGILTIKGGAIDNTSASAVTLTAASQVWDSGFTFIGTQALNTGTGAIALSTGTVLTIQGGLFTVGGALGGNASITKAGAGKLQLEAAATYTGSTTVAGGTLSTNAANLLPSSTDVTIEAGAAIELGGAQVIESLRGAGNLATVGGLTLSNGSGNSFSGVLSGAGSVTLGAGTLTLAGTNTYSGVTTINTGATLQIANSAALGDVAGATSISAGATLDLNGQSNVQETIDIRGAAGALLNSAGAAASVSGVVKLWENGNIGGAGDLTLSGGVNEDGSRSLTKVGAGIFTLAGSSSFTGSTTVSQGLLRLGSLNALGSAAAQTSGVTVDSGAALDFNGLTSAVDVQLTISGTGIGSAGALTNSGAAATYGGSIALGAAASVSGGMTLNGDITGAFALTKVGSGTLILAGATNEAASVSVARGILQVGDNATSGTLGTGNVSIEADASLVFKRSDDYSAAVNNVISGAGSLTVATGVLTLGAANTYTGMTRLLNGSTLVLGSAGALGTSSEARVDAGALLDLGGNASSVNLFLDGQSDSVAALTNSGAAVTYGGLVSLATGTVSAIGSGDIILSRAVSGGTLAKVGANTLTLGSLNSFGKTSVNSGTLRLADTGSFGTEDVQVNAGAQIIFARTDSSVVDKSISGAGTVSVEAGTLTLIGINTYTGATNVAGATLSIGNGGVNGSIASDIAFDATSSLKFNLSSDSIYGGSLSGVAHVHEARLGHPLPVRQQ